MKNTTAYFICSILVGAIIFLIGLTIQKTNINLSMANITCFSFLCTILCYGLLHPSIRHKLKHYFADIDWAEATTNFYQSIPSVYRKSFWISFIFINLAFLFHTINFMWGAYDWGAIRTTVDTSASIKEGYFASFLLQNILFDGKILPVINNLWSFVGLSLGGILLCIYWKMPQKTHVFVITTLFLSITPYTLGWLYFAQNTLGNLWLPAIILSALILSQKENSSLNKNYINNLFSIGLFIIALGTYFPSISFIAIAILGKIFLTTSLDHTSLRETSAKELQCCANLMAALLIYIFIIILLKNNNNNPIIGNVSFYDVIMNIPLLISSSFTQFTTPLPFIDISYKLFNLLLVLIAIFSLINKTTTKSAIIGLCLIPIILIFSKIPVLFYNNPTTPHIARIDFYSIPLFYTLMFATLIKINTEYLKRITYTLACLIIFMSFVRISYALKVWKFGWDAETKLAERIITRMEKMPEFDISRQYKLLQIGETSLRNKYYIKKNNEAPSNELLNFAYYKSNNAKDAYNFFYQADFVSANANLKEAINNYQIREYILNNARPWPAKESIFIIDDYIVFVLDEKALYQMQQFIIKN